jgi:hypothetical protein
VLALTGLLVVVIYVVAFETLGGRAGAPADATRSLLPYQVLFRDLPSGEQRVFRAMQEGAGEAVRMRSEAGGWPPVDALSDGGIPPFARDPLDRASLRWTLQRDGLVANYVGTPASTDGSPLFMIHVQEPDPVTGEKPPPPSVVDEEHQLLADGSLLHVTYWKRPPPDRAAGTIADPALAGWRQIRVKSPLEELEQWRDRLFRDS